MRRDLLDKDMDKLHKNYQLCEKHFEQKYISKGATRKRLFNRAVPTIFSHILKDDATDKSTVGGTSRKINILSGELLFLKLTKLCSICFFLLR